MRVRAVTRSPEIPRSEFGPVRNRVARIETEVLAPAPVVTVLLLTVAIHKASTLQQAIVWSIVSAAFAAFIPLAYGFEV